MTPIPESTITSPAPIDPDVILCEQVTANCNAALRALIEAGSDNDARGRALDLWEAKLPKDSR
jgi:hypothetical protein